MSVRQALAEWLAPEVHLDARRYQFLRLLLSEAQGWLGYEFPDVDAAIHWAKVTEVNHFRAIDREAVEAVPGKPWIHTISDFREHLRQNVRQHAVRDNRKDEPTPWVTIPPGKQFGRQLTADAVRQIAPGTLLRLHSEDPWFEPGEHMPDNGEIVVFTGNVNNDFPKVGPHLEVKTLDGHTYPGGGWVYHLFQFVAAPQPREETKRPMAPKRDPMTERSEEQWDAYEKALATVYSFREGRTLSADDLAALHLVDRYQREDEESATDAFHSGREEGLRAQGGDELVRLDKRVNDLIVEKSTEHFMRRCAEIGNDRLTFLLAVMAACAVQAPVEMILFCPACGLQHIDEETEIWSNPPHRSHLCGACGHIWRPADIATEGVAWLDGHGKADSAPIRERAGYAQDQAGEIERLRGALTEINHGYGVNHTSKWVRNFARAALSPPLGGGQS